MSGPTRRQGRPRAPITDELRRQAYELLDLGYSAGELATRFAITNHLARRILREYIATDWARFTGHPTINARTGRTAA